ncbi:MAG: nucleotide sugar dehydrogenase [Alphaproteobacteria bacterium]|nr:nucleotide sugar dehydrogenase [Alphaproteobacteria bacterium]
MPERIAVIGLGYVGLPVALAFARSFPGTIGFDIDRSRVAALQQGDDWTGECVTEVLEQSALTFSADPADLRDATFFIVAVPTPIDANNQPDLRAVQGASRTVAAALKPGDVVVYESTVYPGVTEEVCGPILAEVSGLEVGKDFHLGYSPERINPGDKLHTIEKITKVVSGDDAATLERVATAYGTVIEAGVHRAASIRVAEAAKVIENTQRDLNIALMNELALIFDRLAIPTRDVLAAAGTKWNFLPFTPGLVGGHCIGVDPYYLTAKAQAVGYHPEVILAGRRINDSMATYVGQRMVKLLAGQGNGVKDARVGILGLTFKENVPDLRNSKVPGIVAELRDFHVEVLVHDPMADAEEAHHEFGLSLAPLEAFRDLDGLVIAVAHRAYRDRPVADLTGMVKPGGVVVDVKSLLRAEDVPDGMAYWSL